jgi:hypothetical protein
MVVSSYVHFQIHSICQSADRVGQALQSSLEQENSSQTHGHLHLNISDLANDGCKPCSPPKKDAWPWLGDALVFAAD